MEWNFYVYMLRCSDGSFYVGVTNDIDRRFYEHGIGRSSTCYTYKRRPLSLVLCEHYQYIFDAISREKQIKRWSKEKKEALFTETSLLPPLARRRTSWIVPIKLRSATHRRIVALLGAVMVRSDACLSTHCVSNHGSESGEPACPPSCPPKPRGEGWKLQRRWEVIA